MLSSDSAYHFHLTYLEIDVVREKVLETVVWLLVDDRQQFFFLGLEKSGPVGLYRGRHQIRTGVDRVLIAFIATFGRSLPFFLRFCASTLLFLPSDSLTMLLLLLLLLLLSRLSSQYLDDDRFLGRLKATHRVFVTRVRYILTIYLQQSEQTAY